MNSDYPVVIAGRGPVGMTLALKLAAGGIPSLVVDPNGRDIAPGTKALCMHHDAIQILDEVGIGREMVDIGVAWDIGRTYYGTDEIATIHIDHPPALRLPPFVNMPQSLTEELLLARVLQEPLIDTRWGWKVSGFHQSSPHQPVEVSLSSVDGKSEGVVTAQYLVGCDGSRSAVRRAAGISFEGEVNAVTFLIADFIADLPYANERRLWFDPPFNPGKTVLLHPAPHRMWHTDWQVGDRVDADEELASGRMDERIDSMLGPNEHEITWVTAYRFNQKIAERFSIGGRVFLAGDAAHVYSPYGARGLNSGLVDADNLAWKLLHVMHHGFSERLLDTYHTERHAAAQVNLAMTGRTARFMAPESRWGMMKRNAVLAAARLVPRANRWVDAGRFYTAHPYALGEPFHVGETPPWTGTAVGGIVPNIGVRVAAQAGAVECSLRSLLSGRHLLLVFPRDGADTASLEEVLAGRSADTPYQVALVITPGVHEVPDLSGLGDLTVIEDVDWSLASAVRGPRQTFACVLLRPDGHVAAVAHTDQIPDRSLIERIESQTSTQRQRQEDPRDS